MRERLRAELRTARRVDAPSTIRALFAEVDALLRAGHRSERSRGAPASRTARRSLHVASRDRHALSVAPRRARRPALIVFVKRRLLMPVFRWLFEYSRDNFERQRRVNQVLFACVQELAIETARAFASRCASSLTTAIASRPPTREARLRRPAIRRRHRRRLRGALPRARRAARCRATTSRCSPRCARDYVTWANACPAGETTENGVRVRPLSRGAARAV